MESDAQLQFNSESQNFTMTDYGRTTQYVSNSCIIILHENLPCKAEEKQPDIL